VPLKIYAREEPDTELAWLCDDEVSAFAMKHHEAKRR